MLLFFSRILLCFLFFFYLAVQAAEDEDFNGDHIKDSRENIVASPVVIPGSSSDDLSDESEFWYQVKRHYDDLVVQVQKVSEDEFKDIMVHILSTLKSASSVTYFQRYQKLLIEDLKEKMVNWIKNSAARDRVFRIALTACILLLPYPFL